MASSPPDSPDLAKSSGVSAQPSKTRKQFAPFSSGSSTESSSFSFTGSSFQRKSASAKPVGQYRFGVNAMSKPVFGQSSDEPPSQNALAPLDSEGGSPTRGHVPLKFPRNAHSADGTPKVRQAFGGRRRDKTQKARPQSRPACVKSKSQREFPGTDFAIGHVLSPIRTDHYTVLFCRGTP